MISYLSFLNLTSPSDENQIFLTNLYSFNKKPKSVIEEFTISNIKYQIYSVFREERCDKYQVRLTFYGNLPQSLNQEEEKKLQNIFQIYLENNRFKVGIYLITLEEIY